MLADLSFYYDDDMDLITVSFSYIYISSFFGFDITRTESRSVGFEPTTLGFGDTRSTELN